ncbi:thioredoxin family protein [Silvimonas amylolytica]|uniref:Lipoprotein n=1 Tax=Silvimonas amylolytica TaxID=449663 RepID=A0ABQ2PNM1_9NEIS|nr:thioredoxin fold domain-containing protein [Silvimonas amylolytica]GGP27208.1 lipoprotein [Silvimonas amylolytica]
MNRFSPALAFAGAMLVSAMSLATADASAPAAAHLPPGIAWAQGDVAAAFARAKAENKPLFLYWGAVWCPPCNQVKATIFNQDAFIKRTALFVPVFLDGDTENAQKWGEQFKVRGYPTMILFKPDGTEITRLPGEVDAARYMQVLSLGLNAAHPVKQTLSAALQPGAKLSLDEWRMLADYSWDTDGALQVPRDDLAGALQTLSQHAAANHATGPALRLEFKAIVAAATDKPVGKVEKIRAVDAMRTVLSVPAITRSNFDLIVAYPTEVTRYLTQPGTPARARLGKAWDNALIMLSADQSISTTDRLTALDGRVALARLDQPASKPLPPALLETLRNQVVAADKVTTNGYERQSVISAAGDALTHAGLIDESDILLRAELKRSPAPYYFMSGLAFNARTRGDKAAALGWYEQAWNASEGPATRLRWGVSYLDGMMELAPQDEARLSLVTGKVLDELAHTSSAFYGSNRAALQRWTTHLAKWNASAAHDAAFKPMMTRMVTICDKLPSDDPQKTTCHDLVKAASASPAV